MAQSPHKISIINLCCKQTAPQRLLRVQVTAATLEGPRLRYRSTWCFSFLLGRSIVPPPSLCVTEATPFLQFPNSYCLPTLWIIYTRNEGHEGEKDDQIYIKSVICDQQKMGWFNLSLKSKIFWQLFYCLKIITLLPQIVNSHFRVWLFQMANINGQVKTRYMGHYYMKFQNKTVGLQFLQKPNHNRKKRERERKRAVKLID